MKRAFPHLADNHPKLRAQRKANGSFKVKHMERHVALYFGVSPRAIRFMMPTGRMAEENDTLNDLRDRWTCQIVLEHCGRKR